MSNTRWAKITSEWIPKEGKRVRGRPKRRWRDNIEEVGSSQWMRVAQNRSAWSHLWRPSASRGMNGYDDDDDDDDGGGGGGADDDDDDDEDDDDDNDDDDDDDVIVRV